MPSDLAEQVPLVREACEALGVPVLTSDRFEADDVIGTLAVQARAAGYDVAIVTGDKDFFQLVGDGVRVFNPRDEGTWYDAAGVVEKFGVRPDQVVDVLALMGDSVDNIKGVPGIGEKGARELISTHGTLDALLEAAPTIQQKRYREGLLAHADDARLSRQLAHDSHRRAGDVRCRTRFASPAPRRAVLRAVLVARVPDADRRVRADVAERRRAQYRRRPIARGRRRAGGATSNRPPASASPRLPADTSGVRADVVGWAFSPPRPGSAVYVPVGAFGPHRHAESAGSRRVRAARPGARRTRRSPRPDTI